MRHKTQEEPDLSILRKSCQILYWNMTNEEFTKIMRF